MMPRFLPEPTFFVPDRGEPRLRWGMIGTGWIAEYFAPAVRRHTTQVLAAVTSRTPERAAAFAARHGIERVHPSAEALVSDPDVDVVYIAAPQSEHLTLGMLAIAAGKHVLIEKPLATTADDARIILDAARAAGVFVMEAMWTRYLPHMLVIRQLVDDGVLGEVLSVTADHGQALAGIPGHRLLEPGTGGGSLLDIGIYPVQLDSMVRGTPTAVTATGALTASGVDAYATLVLTHETGEQSTLMSSILTQTASVAAVNGTEARVNIAGPFHIPNGFTLHAPELFAPHLSWEDPTGVTILDGLAWEVTAFAGYVGESRIESPLHPHREVVDVLRTIDSARAQLGAR
jgi:predicted dehydrogenase